MLRSDITIRQFNKFARDTSMPWRENAQNCLRNFKKIFFFRYYRVGNYFLNDKEVKYNDHDFLLGRNAIVYSLHFRLNFCGKRII